LGLRWLSAVTRVGQQRELGVAGAAGTSRIGQEADRGTPLGIGQPHVAREAVQVLHQARHHLPKARIGSTRMPRDHGLRDGVFVDVAHAWRALGSSVRQHRAATLDFHFGAR
jgi:hypothetical protein